MDCSVIDSEYVTEYCQNKMQVSNEKRRYSSGSEDDENDNISRESTTKNRLSFLSTDSDLKIQSDFMSETDGVNFIDETEKIDKKVGEKSENKDSIGEFAREFIYNLIDSVKKEFPDIKDKTEVTDNKINTEVTDNKSNIEVKDNKSNIEVTDTKNNANTTIDTVKDTQKKTDSDANKVTADKTKSPSSMVEVVFKESAPNTIVVENDSYHSEPMIDMFCQPLLGRVPSREADDRNQS